MTMRDPIPHALKDELRRRAEADRARYLGAVVARPFTAAVRLIRRRRTAGADVPVGRPVR